MNATEHILSDVTFSLHNLNMKLKNRGDRKDFQLAGKNGNTSSWKVNESYSPIEVEELHMDIRLLRSDEQFNVKR